MNKLFLVLLTFLIGLSIRAATVVIKVSEFPNRPVLEGTDLLLIAVPGVTNANISWDQLKLQIGTNGATFNSFQFITNNYFYSTNAEIQFVTNNYAYITNLYATTEYVTNLFVTDITTNFIIYNTNIYNSDAYVSNYFVTNVFNNTYMSNFYSTNIVVFETNSYQTNINVTNTFLGDTFVSNFYATNIFVTDNSVSNYFTTNFFQTIEITSNFTYNVSWPMTNATLYGVTTFSPISGTDPGRIILLSGSTPTISLTASNGLISAGTGEFTNLTAGSYVGVGPNGSLIPTNPPAFVTNLTSQTITTSNLYSTNIFTTNLYSSNIYTTNIFGDKAKVTQIYVSDAMITNNIFRFTNSWANGPTGAVNMNLSRQRFRASTPCYISGITGRSNNVTSEVLMSIDCISGSSNIWVTFTNGFRWKSGTSITNTVAVTNGTTLKAWLEYDPSGANSVGETNVTAFQYSFPP